MSSLLGRDERRERAADRRERQTYTIIMSAIEGSDSDGLMGRGLCAVVHRRGDDDESRVGGTRRERTMRPVGLIAFLLYSSSESGSRSEGE